MWLRVSALPLTLTCSAVCPPGEGANTEMHPVLSSCYGSIEVTITRGRLQRAGAAEPEPWGQGAPDVCKAGGTLQLVGRHLVQTWRIQARVPCCAWSSKNMRVERAGAGGGTPGKGASSMRAVCWADSWLSSEDTREHWKVFRRSDAKNSVALHQCRIKSQRQSFGWNRKAKLYCFVRQRRTQQALALKKCVSPPRRIG